MFPAGELNDVATARDGWWKPGVATTWQWQLSGAPTLAYDVDMYDLDLFDTPTKILDELHREGRRVVCYFSAGSSETWRDDIGGIGAAAMGAPLDGWPDEHWLDVSDESVRAVMVDRLDLAVMKGCDGVEPDNVDGFANDTGLDLTREQQLDFNRWLADEAHRRARGGAQERSTRSRPGRRLRLRRQRAVLAVRRVRCRGALRRRHSWCSTPSTTGRSSMTAPRVRGPRRSLRTLVLPRAR
ncbi:MAG: endo alpha-1,4 polygalactosaminidase [Acidimicrobiales bacterium]